MSDASFRIAGIIVGGLTVILNDFVLQEQTFMKMMESIPDISLSIMEMAFIMSDLVLMELKEKLLCFKKNDNL